MDISNINTNINPNIQNIDNNASSLQLNKNNAASKVADSSVKESLSLNIKDYNVKRDELSLNVQNLNEGIAQIKIAQNGLEDQKTILEKIQQNIQNAKTEDGKIKDSNEMKNSMNNDLQEFNKIAYEAQYKSQNLLTNDMYDPSKNEINISTKYANFDINKPNTVMISTDIFNTYNTSDLNQPQAVDQLTQKVESSINQIKNTIDQFTSFGDRLETSARQSIQEQVSMYNQNTLSQQINFGKESSNFSKNNIIAVQGFLAATQANILQEQSVKLIGS